MTFRRKTFTDEQFIEAVKSSISVRQTLQKLGLIGAGGNYRMFKILTKQLNIDYSHFTGQAHLKGKKHSWSKKIPLDQILIENSEYDGGTMKIKERLIKENIIENKCSVCGILECNGQKLSLCLHHINGNNTDNRLENLQLLCPNCHSLTDNFCGKGIKHKKKPKKIYLIEHNKCIDCGKEILKHSIRCKNCGYKQRSNNTKILWPPLEKLLERLKTTPYITLAKELGVSDNAIRKHIEKLKMAQPEIESGCLATGDFKSPAYASSATEPLVDPESTALSSVV
jgi:hypothetical protein